MNAGNATVYGDNEAEPFFCSPAKRCFVRSIAFRETVRDITLCHSSDFNQGVPENRSGTHAVDVIITINQNHFAFVDGTLNPFDDFRHILKGKWIMECHLIRL